MQPNEIQNPTPGNVTSTPSSPIQPPEQVQTSPTNTPTSDGPILSTPRKSNKKAWAAAIFFSILVILAGGSYALYHFKHETKPTLTHHNSTKTSSGSTTGSQSTSNAGWKTYNWTAEGLSFKYPSTWSMNNPQVPQNQQQSETPSEPAVFLFSPDIVTETGFVEGSSPNMSDTYTGSFVINATKDTASNITGSSEAGVQDGVPANAYIDKVIPLSVPGYKQMYIIEEGQTSISNADLLALTDLPVKVGLTTSSSDDSFQSKTTPADRISFTLGLFSEAKDSPDNFDFINLPANTFEKLGDYNTALKILESISYQ